MADLIAQWQAEAPSLIGSIVAVAAMVGFAVALGFRDTARIADEAQLARLVAEAEPEARIVHALIGADGRAALARLADGRVLAAAAMGADISLRIAEPGRARIRRRPGRISIALGDVGFPHLHLRIEGGSEPPAWLLDLARQGAH